MLDQPPSLFILGVDGGSLDVIEPLMAAGRLPVLAGLLAGSAYGTTECTWPAHTAPGWSTLLTASAPGGHGIYQFFDTQEPGYGARVMGPDDVGRSTAWDWLAAQGLSLGLANVPMSHPPRPLPGYQLTWPLVPTLHYCHPPALLRELAGAGLRFRSDLATMYRGDHRYLTGALANVTERVRACGHLMATQPTDVTMLVLTEPDRVCHHFWHFADPAHPQYREPEQAEWADAIGLVYEAVDQALGELLELVGPQTPVLVVSDHGFGAGGEALALNRLLAEAGLLVTAPAEGPVDTGGEVADWFVGASTRVDFDRTVAYCPVPGSYGINVNLVGRQRRGIVSDPGPVLDAVTDLLLRQRTPAGGPVFRAVVPAEAAYSGPSRPAGPDLLLIPADESVMVTSEFEGPLWRPSEQTGLHRNEGMWAYRSDTVRPGRVDRSLALADVLPTVLCDRGWSWPASVHGRPALDLLTGDRRPAPLAEAEAPVRRDRPPGPAEVMAGRSTGEALRAMGYL